MGLEPEHKVGVTPVVTLVNTDADGGMVTSLSTLAERSRSLPNHFVHATFSTRNKRKYAMPVTRTSGPCTRELLRH
jgi:hypothetical protein